MLTRDADYFIELGARVDKAQLVKADLFVSIHADAFIKPHVAAPPYLRSRSAVPRARLPMLARARTRDLSAGQPRAQEGPLSRNDPQRPQPDGPSQ